MISTLLSSTSKLVASRCMIRNISGLNAQRDPFVVTPESYITTLSDVDEKNVDIIQLNPSKFRVI